MAEVEAWINDKMALVTSSDYGKDEDASDRLLAKNKVTIVSTASVCLLKISKKVEHVNSPHPHPFFFPFFFCNKGFWFDEYLL